MKENLFTVVRDIEVTFSSPDKDGNSSEIFYSPTGGQESREFDVTQSGALIINRVILTPMGTAVKALIAFNKEQWTKVQTLERNIK